MTDLEVALLDSDRAAQLALRHFAAGVESAFKRDGSPVTEADRAVERLIRDEIHAVLPDDEFLGEELGGGDLSDRVWIMDPIDGTSCFARNEPQWRVHLALEVAGRIDVAVVTAPALGVQWWASRGSGAFEATWPRDGGGRRLAVTATATLSEARLDGVDDACRARLPTRNPPERQSHSWCGGLVALLRGEADGFLADRFQVWDHAPWTLLVEEAGGRFTGRPGERRTGQGGGLYSNGHLHDALLAAIGYPAAT